MEHELPKVYGCVQGTKSVIVCRKCFIDAEWWNLDQALIITNPRTWPNDCCSVCDIGVY